MLTTVKSICGYFKCFALLASKLHFSGLIETSLAASMPMLDIKSVARLVIYVYGHYRPGPYCLRGLDSLLLRCSRISKNCCLFSKTLHIFLILILGFIKPN